MEFHLLKRNDLKASSFARAGGDHQGCRSKQNYVNRGNDSPHEARTCHLQDIHLDVVLSDLARHPVLRMVMLEFERRTGVAAKDWRKVAKRRQIYEMELELELELELILLIKEKLPVILPICFNDNTSFHLHICRVSSAHQISCGWGLSHIIGSSKESSNITSTADI